MMKTRLNGTERPKKDAGGLRHGLLVLAVLLLTCVLMAGAVSAEEPVAKLNNGTEYATIQDAIDSSDSLNYTITLLSDVTLTIDSQKAPIEISGKKIVLDLNGKTISGTDTLSTQTTAGNAMLIEVRGATSALTLYDNSSEKTGTITLKAEMNREWNAMSVIIRNSYSKLTINGGNLTHLGGTDMAYAVDTTAVNNANADLIVNGGKLSSTYTGIRNFANSADAYSNITVTGGEISGEARGIWIQQPSSSAGLNTLTVQGGTISGTGDKGRALYLYQNAACQSIVSISGGVFKNKKDSQNGVICVTVVNDAKASTSSVSISGATLTTLTGEEPLVPVLVTVEGDVIAPVTTWNDETLLFPGVEYADSVEWTGDDDSGYTLTIDEAGSYKLMDAFATTGSGIQITADGVTLDGNDKKITTAGDLGGYILKVSVEKNAENAKGVTLQNLDITGGVASGTTGNYGGITVSAGTNTLSVPVTLRDSTIDMSGVTVDNSMNPAVYFVNASNSEIANNVIKAGNTKATGSSADGVTSRGIVIDGGSEITVSKNDVTMGTGAKVSIGIQFKNGPTDVTLAGNSIRATNSDGEKLNRAIDITTLGQEGESYTITGTKLLAEDGVSFESAVNVIVSSSAPENAELSLTTNGNDFSNVEKGIALVSWAADPKPVKLSGSINADDFPGISQEEIIALSANLQDKVKTDVDWTHDPEPQPVYSSGGNMNNAYRVLFNDGATTLSVVTDLSSGDKLTKPETPVKDGYTFAGWYKDEACTQAWDFETGIPGDMTLYAKWTAAGSSGETEATATPTKTQTAVTTPQPTKTQTAAATTSAPEATTAAGVSPTLTQAPAPVAGALFGLLAAGVLLRRRFQ